MGEDRFSRPVYLSQNGTAIVDINPRNPRKDLRTKWPSYDVYYGEPDCHLAEDLRPIFMDQVIEIINTTKEMAGDPDRYQLKGCNVYVCTDIEAGDDFEILNNIQVEALVNLATPVIFDGHEIESLIPFHKEKNT